MRWFLGINEVLGIPEPDNFITKTGRCFKWRSILFQQHTTKLNKKDGQQTEDEMLEVFEANLQAAPS